MSRPAQCALHLNMAETCRTVGQCGWSAVASGIVKIAFYCQADGSIGGGHVVRCLALGAELARRGHEIAFLAGGDTRAAVPALSRSGFALLWFEGDASAARDALAPHWKNPADWLVVDCYRIGRAEERELRNAATALMVIDDLANRTHDCDLLVDQSLGREAGAYARLTPPRCVLLTGSRFALLRQEFAAARPEALERRRQADGLGAPVRRILVALGLTDVGAVTARVVEALLPVAASIRIDVVTSGAAPSLARLRTCAAHNAGLALHLDATGSQMAALMGMADVAVGAGGVTSLERLCLGVPSIVLAVAENQRGQAAALVRLGAALAVDPERGGLAAQLHAALHALRGPARHEMSRVAGALCDGEGVCRVAEAMATTFAAVRARHLP